MKMVKRYGKKADGKKYKKYKAKMPPKAVICYCPQVCPDVMSVQLKYNSGKVSAGGGLVNIQDYVWRGNGPVDPDFEIGGQQPLGYDEWARFYRRYRVKACKIDVLFSNNASVSAFGYVVANLTSSGLTDRSALESAYQKKVNIGQDSGNNQGKISMYCSTAQVRGGPVDIVQYEQDLSAVVLSSPAQEWYFHTGAYGQGSGGSGLNFEVDMNVTLTYYVEFYDRETLNRS